MTYRNSLGISYSKGNREPSSPILEKARCQAIPNFQVILNNTRITKPPANHLETQNQLGAQARKARSGEDVAKGSLRKGC